MLLQNKGGPPYSELNYSSTLHKHFPYEAIPVLSLLHHCLGHFLVGQERRHRSIHSAQPALASIWEHGPPSCNSLKHLAKMPFLALSTPTAVCILKAGDAGHLATIQPGHAAALVHTQALFSRPPVPGDPEPAAGTLEQRLGLE